MIAFVTNRETKPRYRAIFRNNILAPVHSRYSINTSKSLIISMPTKVIELKIYIPYRGLCCAVDLSYSKGVAWAVTPLSRMRPSCYFSSVLYCTYVPFSLTFVRFVLVHVESNLANTKSSIIGIQCVSAL